MERKVCVWQFTYPNVSKYFICERYLTKLVIRKSLKYTKVEKQTAGIELSRQELIFAKFRKTVKEIKKILTLLKGIPHLKIRIWLCNCKINKMMKGFTVR